MNRFCAAWYIKRMATKDGCRSVTSEKESEGEGLEEGRRPSSSPSRPNIYLKICIFPGSVQHRQGPVARAKAVRLALVDGDIPNQAWRSRLSLYSHRENSRLAWHARPWLKPMRPYEARSIIEQRRGGWYPSLLPQHGIQRIRQHDEGGIVPARGRLESQMRLIGQIPLQRERRQRSSARACDPAALDGNAAWS